MNRRCDREGCEQPVSVSKPGNRYCSFACRGTDLLLQEAEQMCRAIGSASSAAGELWAAAVEVNDALSRYQEIDRRLYTVACAVGFTPDQWYGLKHSERKNQLCQQN